MFDEMAKQVATATSRRRAVQGLGGMALGALGLVVAVEAGCAKFDLQKCQLGCIDWCEGDLACLDRCDCRCRAEECAEKSKKCDKKSGDEKKKCLDKLEKKCVRHLSRCLGKLSRMPDPPH